MDNNDSRERKQALESKKRALLNKLKRISSQVNYKSYELKIIKTLLDGKGRPNIRHLRRRVNILEFKVETEATSLKLERKLMKQIKQTQQELQEATKLDRLFRKFAYLESDISEASKEMDKIELELQGTNTEIIELERQFHEEKKRHISKDKMRRILHMKDQGRKESKKERDKEMEQYLGSIDEGVSLEDICIIKRKEDKK
ncbi:MAG: hypothetical protein ABIG39_03650 [Candidatus Micrarchaeota archaeon]